MTNNFFISGIPKAGKTTLLNRIIKELKSQGYSVGGFVSPEIKEHGTREGFYVEDVASGKTALLASTVGDGPKISKYHVDVKSFESIALPCMHDTKKYDVVFIDEIGRMELESVKFGDALEELLQSPKPIIASLHGDFVREYENFGNVYRMTENNRNEVEMEIMNSLMKILGKPSKKIEKKQVESVNTGKRKIEIKEGKREAIGSKPEARMAVGRRVEAVDRKAKEKNQMTKIRKKNASKQKEKEKKPEKKEEKKGFLGKIKKFFGI